MRFRVKCALLVSVLLGIGGCLLLRLQIQWKRDKAQCERQLVAIRMAIDQMNYDRQQLKEALERREPTVDKIARFVADPRLNRLALIYRGSDWTGERSEFQGKVDKSRTQIKMLTEILKERKGLLNKKIKYLGDRRHSLKTQMRTPSDVLARQAELNEVERQLASLRSESGIREFLNADSVSRDAVAGIQNEEDAIADAVTACQRATVDDLTTILRRKILLMKSKENYFEEIRRSASVLDIVTVSRLLLIGECEHGE